jgi:hypothetical protein
MPAQQSKGTQSGMNRAVVGKLKEEWRIGRWEYANWTIHDYRIDRYTFKAMA